MRANVAPWLDLLFGTHHDPTRDEASLPIGLVASSHRAYAPSRRSLFRT